MKIGVVGVGEVGSSIASLYKDENFSLHLLDSKLGLIGDIDSCDILNICIPYSDSFVQIVNDYVESCNPKLVIIHSSVLPGTTKKIRGKVCYSPIRGTHPNLEAGIRTFEKYIGAENTDWSIEYQNHLNLLGVNSYICRDSKTAEFAKVIDTTYYGVCIAFHNEIQQLCTEQEIDFDEVMTRFNESYNSGYAKLGKPNVIRPVLVPGKKIGGHCVIPNAHLLSNFIDSPLIEGVVKYS